MTTFRPTLSMALDDPENLPAPLPGVHPTISGIWHSGSFGTVTTVTPAANEVIFVPIYFGSPYAFTQIAINQTAGTGNAFKIGLYSQWNGLPGFLLSDLGIVNVSGAAALKTLTVSGTVRRGRTYVGFLPDVNCTVSGLTAASSSNQIGWNTTPARITYLKVTSGVSYAGGLPSDARALTWASPTTSAVSPLLFFQ